MKINFDEFFKGKKKNENLVVLLILMIIVVVLINYIWNGKNNKKTNVENFKNENNIVQVSNNEISDNVEDKLEKILSKISGVGKVKVMITYSESSSIVPIYDETSKASNTTESDQSGGTRSISETNNQKQIIYKQNSDGSKEPMTKSILSPQIAGAIIAATGAGDVNVKANIIQAVEAATGLATHKIQVFEMEVN